MITVRIHSGHHGKVSFRPLCSSPLSSSGLGAGLAALCHTGLEFPNRCYADDTHLYPSFPQAAFVIISMDAGPPLLTNLAKTELLVSHQTCLLFLLNSRSRGWWSADFFRSGGLICAPSGDLERSDASGLQPTGVHVTPLDTCSPSCWPTEQWLDLLPLNWTIWPRSR